MTAAIWTDPSPEFICFANVPMKPRRAGRDAGGSLPVRAYRYCEAITSACAFGWWLYPPTDLWLQYDGHTCFYSLNGESYRPLDDTAAYPGSVSEIGSWIPDSMSPIEPALLTALQEPGNVQISLGIIARTAPGWSLLLRAPANLPLFGGYDHSEAIVATDTWFGPLFINLRLTRTHSPIRLHAQAPLVQAQPLPRWLYQDAIRPTPQVRGIDSMSPDDWAAWQRVFVEPDSRPDRRDGEYATAQRKRDRGNCPMLNLMPEHTPAIAEFSAGAAALV